VLKTRYWVRFGWRLVAALILFRGLWDDRDNLFILMRGMTDPGSGLIVGDTLLYLVFTPLPYVIIAGAMLLTERWAIRFLVPDPFTGCAKCGYPKGISRGPCPECGELEQ